MKNIESLTEKLRSYRARSSWKIGVKIYALELVGELDEAIRQGWQDDDVIESPALLEKALLNGARSWTEYSWGGAALIYDHQIAARLCNPTELKQTRNGDRRPNAREEWLDVQARALSQAARLIEDLAKAVRVEPF